MIIVLFEVTIKNGRMDEYMKLVGDLKTSLAEAEGFIRAERFSSLANEGKLLSLTVWENEKAVEQWRNVERHRMSQRQGRDDIFENYTITVVSPIRTYSNQERVDAPEDSNEQFGFLRKDFGNPMNTDKLNIEPATQVDFPGIVDVWEASVRATHDFLSEEDIQDLKPLILNEYLKAVELYCVREGGKVLGFLGLSPDKIEMLFIHPDARGKGIGKSLTLFAIREKGIRKVDVNEQNPQAVGFYEHMGFEVVSRSPLDPQGKPFPILSMEIPGDPNLLNDIQKTAAEQFDRQSDRYGKSHILVDTSDIAAALDGIELRAGGAALDIATGGGHMALYLARLGYRVIAGDVSQRMLDQAAHLVAEAGYGLETRLFPAESIPFGDATFDFVGSRVAPHHFSDPASFVREAARVLRPAAFFC